MLIIIYGSPADSGARGQDGIGDGGLYSLWAGGMLVSELLVLLVWWRGGQWREAAEKREAEKAERAEQQEGC
jgi:hypothetical protein